MWFLFVLFMAGVATDQCVLGVDENNVPTVKSEQWNNGKTHWNPDPAKKCD